MNSYSLSTNDNFPFETDDSNSKPDDIYVFVKFLGEGSFGKVNLYQNTSDNSLVVWKEINLKRLDTKARNEAFSEVEILSILDHPNIITYFKHFIGDDILYIELEYAKSGTLSNLIKQCVNLNEIFDQDTALWYFYQLSSAVNFVHEMGIMHRDIKTLNIFVMQSGVLKLGDFGIAKIFYDNVPFAESIVGTPLYMSPEIIEGKKYTFSSDIWSLGCVMYEILTLTRVFDATNQLKLALKITTCDVNDISVEHYSDELRKLVKKLLSKDPKLRPTAKEILNDPILINKQEVFDSKVENLNLISKRNRTLTSSSISNELSVPMNLNSYQNAVIASKLSEVYQWGAGKLLPKPVEFFKNNNTPYSVALGPSHFAVVTLEKELYTWAASNGTAKPNHAKLGHGKDYGVTRIPKKVDINRVAINQVACGDNFTMCLDDNGDLYTFGIDYLGCLGLGDNCEELFDSGLSVYTPVRIPFFELNSLKVSKIACGEAHCIALVEDEERDRIFTWGCGENGRLGHGDENDLNVPTEINFKVNYKFKNIFAGNDCSFLLTRSEKVLAFGNNEFNKLLFNPKQIEFKSSDFEKSYKETSQINQQLVPKLIRLLTPFNIVKISSGMYHTAVIDIYGRLWTFGSNRFGQLGVGDSKQRSGLNLISGILNGQNVINVACGDTFTICCTSENQVFSWGNYKEGRLGLDSFLESNVLSPKPIFGSLHLVSDMCASRWSCLIIAEKLLNIKPVRNISIGLMNKKNSNSSSEFESLSSELKTTDSSEQHLDVFKNPENEPVTFDLDDDAKEEYRIENSVSESSQIPDWLKKDLEEASFIPIEALDKKEKVNGPVCIESNNKIQDISNRLQEALELIDKLKEENQKLKEENQMLTAQLKPKQI